MRGSRFRYTQTQTPRAGETERPVARSTSATAGRHTRGSGVARRLWLETPPSFERRDETRRDGSLLPPLPAVIHGLGSQSRPAPRGRPSLISARPACQLRTRPLTTQFGRRTPDSGRTHMRPARPESSLTVLGGAAFPLLPSPRTKNAPWPPHFEDLIAGPRALCSCVHIVAVGSGRFSSLPPANLAGVVGVVAQRLWLAAALVQESWRQTTGSSSPPDFTGSLSSSASPCAVLRERGCEEGGPLPGFCLPETLAGYIS